VSILVTGGAGFIGTNFILHWLAGGGERVINLDKLTYAANASNLSGLGPDKYRLIRGDIGDRALVSEILNKEKPRAIINFAAESHVDRSIHNPGEFIQTNVVGFFNLLESLRAYLALLNEESKLAFRFLHVSTDEVYGSLSPEAPPFTELSPYAPNSPYSASKAASDHLVRAYRHTYGLPVITTNCSNNYGPYQFPEKLIPLIIINALKGKLLPVYGDGRQIRDWLHVNDHCRALALVLEQGTLGETYNIGGQAEKSNLEVVETLCDLLDVLKPMNDGKSYRKLVAFVKDRPGHDRRYAINPEKIRRELGFQPRYNFATGLKETARWYLNNSIWVQQVQSGDYLKWLETQYGEH
jgi:dTDP-glucose 4,6-dehydratase